MSNAQKTLTDNQKKTYKDLTGEPFEVKFDRQGGRQGGKPGGGKPRSDF